MALHGSDRDFLFELLAQARQPRPAHWPAWFLRGTDVPLGWIPPERALRLSQALPQYLPLLPTPQGWVWQADHVDAQVRTQVLQHVAQALRAQGPGEDPAGEHRGRAAAVRPAAARRHDDPAGAGQRLLHRPPKLRKPQASHCPP